MHSNLQYSIHLLIVLSTIAIGLAAIAGIRRGKARIWLGHGDNAPLHAAMRAQANFIELTPFVLLLIAALELTGAEGWLLISLAATLVAGRVVHAVSFIATDGGQSVGRTLGSVLTTLTALTALILLAMAVI